MISLVLPLVALLSAVWAFDHNRRVHRWVRGGFSGPMPPLLPRPWKRRRA